MIYNIWLDFSAIIVLLVILAAIYTKRNAPIFQNRIFVVLVWCTLVSTSMDLLSGLWNNNAEMAKYYIPVFVMYLINMIYFIARNVTPFFYLLYILATLNIDIRTGKQKISIFLPVIAAFIAIAVTPVTGFVFALDNEGYYNRGGGLIFLYGIAAYYLISSTVCIIYYRGVLPIQRRIALFSFFVIAVVTVGIQAFFPTVLAEGFGTAICYLLIYLTIQRPEEILDGTTGFMNKKALSTVLAVKMKQRSPFAALLVGIVDYQFLEKSYGLEVMERLLVQIAAFLKNFPKVTFYRFSEDKICIIGNETNMSDIYDRISVIENKFSSPWDIGAYNVMLSVFFGIFFCPEDAENVDGLIELLNSVKPKGEHRVSSIKELDIEGKHRKQKIDNIVKNAVENKLLSVVYQPIYSIDKRRFVSAEALVRLYDPELGNISPAEFIPIAEKNGAIVKIDQFVLDSVCKISAEYNLLKLGIEYIEVNLSTIECLQDNLVESIMEKISKYNLEPNRINLEITETATNILPESVYEKLDQLVNKGVTFSLDDYGTGYSNLNRLVTLPLEIIKIDKSILYNAFKSEQGRVIFDSTIWMVKALKKKVLVEGVETKEQAEYLEKTECDYIQGYYYSRPVKEEQFLAMLKDTLS